MREKVLTGIARFADQRPGLMFGIALLITVGAAGLASQLELVMHINNSKNLYHDLSLLPWLRHLNDSFEKTYVFDQESISTKEKENNAVAFLDGIEH